MSNLENTSEVKRKNSKPNRMKDFIVQDLPNCFRNGEQKQPLCIGIHLQVHTCF